MLRVLHFAICNKKQIDHYKCTCILCVSKCNGKFWDYLLLNSIASALNTSFFFWNVHDECSSFLEIVFFKRISFYFECFNWRLLLFVFFFFLCAFFFVCSFLFILWVFIMFICVIFVGFHWICLFFFLYLLPFIFPFSPLQWKPCPWLLPHWPLLSLGISWGCLSPSSIPFYWGL